MSKRKFVLEITETDDLSITQLGAALQRTGASLATGSYPVEEGWVYGGGRLLGRYGWEDVPSPRKSKPGV